MMLDDYAQEINNLQKNNQAKVDVRLEVILAELYFQGLNPLQELQILPQGLFERNYRKDVGKAEVTKSTIVEDDFMTYEATQKKHLTVEVHRDGLYDYLPEGVFHQPTNRARDQRELFDDFDEQARRIEGARKFFRPLEHEFYLQRLLLELEERKYLITEENLRQNTQSDILREFWGLPPGLLDIRQLNNLLYLLPIAHRIVMDWSLVRQCFELILGVPVELRTIPPLVFSIQLAPGDQPVSNELGHAEMGNFSLSGDYQDTMPAVEIRMGPLNTMQLIDFLEGGRCRKIFRLLVDYFIPIELEVIDFLITDEDKKYLELSDKNPTSVLGVASYI